MIIFTEFAPRFYPAFKTEGFAHFFAGMGIFIFSFYLFVAFRLFFLYKQSLLEILAKNQKLKKLLNISLEEKEFQVAAP